MRKWIDIIEQDDRRQGERRATDRDGEERRQAERRMADNAKKRQEDNLLRDLQAREVERRHKAANAAAKEWDEMGKRKKEDVRDDDQKVRDNGAVADWMTRFEKLKRK